VVHSGLDPTLLAGHVYQPDTSIKPTSSVNLWFARNKLLVEAGANVLSSPAAWSRLLKQLQPGRIDFVKNVQVPRAVVLCISCEQLLSGKIEALAASARTTRSRLEEMSQHFGIQFPVYVLFTKLDCVEFFKEFARNLSSEEASDLLGVTI